MLSLQEKLAREVQTSLDASAFPRPNIGRQMQTWTAGADLLCLELSLHIESGGYIPDVIT